MKQLLLPIAIALSLPAIAMDEFEFSADDAFADFDVTPADTGSFDAAIYRVGYRIAITQASEQSKQLMPYSVSGDLQTLANEAFLAFEQSRQVGEGGYFTLNGEAKLALMDAREAGDERLFSPQVSLSALHYEHSSGLFKTRLGLQSIAWGEVAGMPALDIASPANSANYSTNLAASRVSQWMIATTAYFTPSFEAQGFVNLQPAYTAVPGNLFANAAQITDQELGLRLTMRLPGSDVSVYGGRFYANEPQTILVPMVGPIMSAPEAQVLIGASANIALASWLLASDVSFIQAESQEDKLRLAVSAEYGNQLIGSLTAQAYSQVSDNTPVLLSSVRWSKSFINETVSISGGLSAQDTELESLFAGIQHKWRDGASWQLGSGANLSADTQWFGFAVLEQEF